MLPRIIPREEIEQLLNYMYAQENTPAKSSKDWCARYSSYRTMSSIQNMGNIGWILSRFVSVRISWSKEIVS